MIRHESLSHRHLIGATPDSEKHFSLKLWFVNYMLKKHFKNGTRREKKFFILLFLKTSKTYILGNKTSRKILKEIVKILFEIFVK
jgi:hypothetical protein